MHTSPRAILMSKVGLWTLTILSLCLALTLAAEPSATASRDGLLYRRNFLPSIQPIITESNAAPKRLGYLARGGGMFSLTEGPEPKRPMHVLPPLPLVYNPQPLISGMAAVPLVETSAAPSLRVESHTFTLPTTLPGDPLQPSLPGAFSPQPSTLNPMAVIRMFQTQVGNDRNTTGILLNDVPSLYQVPTHRGSSAAYELKR